MAQPVITSVSGRGTNTPGPTSSSRYLKYARPVMCWSGSRFSRRPMSDPEPGVELRVGHRVQLAALDVVHVRRDDLGVGARRVHARLRQPRRRQRDLIEQRVITGHCSGQLRFQVGGRERVDHRVQVTVDHLVQVVRLVADPVVGDPVLREVVGADPLRPVDGADLGLALGRGLRVRLRLGRGEQPRAQHAQRLLLVLELALLVLAGDHDAGRQVGDPHRRVGRVDRLAARAARTGRRRSCRSLSLTCTSTGSASGVTSTPAAEVWMRPCDSVTGTRCTRCTPPSYFSRDHAPVPPLPALTATVASLTPPSPVTVESMISVFQPCRSA